ncbi:hypothetical protein BV22DRAFT_1193204 [Leucogyrophana mollusca]|uniref:Uncharacterized protein n=1 Tax=Leucogyrophana mollusca TaxID=85980 RepID=A0ACB8BRY3_9AGAM|nr:hypothetical protein BV22DRAFT_1193204 [Leucogyrophana mollusca]
MNPASQELNQSGPQLLCVAQYWRGLDSNGQPLPLHWALFALNGATRESLAVSSSAKGADGQNDHWGTCYQAIGNIDTFEYSCQELEYMELLAQDYRGCLCVGEIDASDLEEVGKLLEKVSVYRGREDWNCQNWVYGALEKLKRNGWVREEVTPNGVKNELNDVLERWNLNA